ncbi:MAG TPA: hypothetical protein VLA77_01060 [Candidatus Saccharimonadales bacterium]|nr:hypothetical protein [Candidatus Saccharimonadales bacterium]
MTKREPPEIIKTVGFDFAWDEKLVWKLKYPVQEMPIRELVWHFEFPFLWSKPDGFYDVKPSDVINDPIKFADEYSRTMKADTKYPIDIMFYKDRWMILDGLHRLMKQSVAGDKVVKVRKIPTSAIEMIKK